MASPAPSDYQYIEDATTHPVYGQVLTPEELYEWEQTPPPCAQPNPDLPELNLEELFNGTIGNTPAINAAFMSSEEIPTAVHVLPSENNGVEQTTADEAAEGEKGLRFNCKYFFLTYPKCDIEPSRFAVKFKALRVEDYHLVREKHDDGTPHYHAIVAFPSRKDIRNPRHFDLDGHHPNIQKVKSLIKCLRYLEKEKHGAVGEHVGGTLAPKIRDGKVGGLDAEAKSARWADAIDSAQDEDEFLNKINAFDPRDLAKSFNNVQQYAKWLYTKKKESTKYKPRDMGEGVWNIPYELSEWRRQNLDFNPGKQPMDYVYTSAVGLAPRHPARGAPPP